MWAFLYEKATRHMPHGLNFTPSPLFENLPNEEPMQVLEGVQSPGYICSSLKFPHCLTKQIAVIFYTLL